ncbi:intelectin-1-like isoform X1 [Clavelina lepadiformis]|uniref:intelectin-1-like isoform X1 n=1 Tax=Clavelina lepadiformis TaxID=159417 RepID=UPI00404350DC
MASLGKLVLLMFLGALTCLCQSQEPEQCNLYCARSGSASGEPVQRRGPPGAPGKQGPPGDVQQCDCCSSKGEVCQRLRELTEEVESLRTVTRRSSFRSCKEIKTSIDSSATGLHKLVGPNGNEHTAYCDMDTDEGGWTLVASIHENNIGSSGRCTVGDRWSTEQGNVALRPNGDGNWENLNVFGNVVAATSDDYKSPGYFEIAGRDLMIWQVPNNTPLQNYNTSTYLKYRTTNGFLSQYGGNLYHLYSEHYPIRSGVYNFPSDSGPSVPVTFDKGDANSLHQHFPPNAKSETEPGFIQFRAISSRRYAFALCPGVRNKPTFNYPSQSCLGSTGATQGTYCGDFSGWLHDGHAVGSAWSADQTLLSTTFLLFYR